MFLTNKHVAEREMTADSEFDGLEASVSYTALR